MSSPYAVALVRWGEEGGGNVGRLGKVHKPDLGGAQLETHPCLPNLAIDAHPPASTRPLSYSCHRIRWPVLSASSATQPPYLQVGLCPPQVRICAPLPKHCSLSLLAQVSQIQQLFCTAAAAAACWFASLPSCRRVDLPAAPLPIPPPCAGFPPGNAFTTSC